MYKRQFLFSMRTYKANVMSLYAMFFIYSALNGVTLSLVSLAYGIMEATVPALIGALAFFVAFSIVGLTTKKNLAGLTPYLVAAIFGMIIVSLVFMAASYFSIPYLSSISYSTISLILGYVGVVVFSIFTAVDMNKMCIRDRSCVNLLRVAYLLLLIIRMIMKASNLVISS